MFVRALTVAVFWMCLLLSAAGKPNIIVVLIDDMGWGDFSCFGNKEAKTPNIDRLAAEGMKFTQFYVSAPICSPSRCGLLTGQYPQRWSITSFLNNRADNKRRGVADWLDVKAPTLARILKSGGYATGHFGKWHLGGQRDVDDAPAITAYGFDESLTNFEGMGPKLLPLTLKPGDAKPGRIWEGAERLGKPVTWMQRSQITGGYVAAAVKFIDGAGDKPFYINLWPDDVHSPFWPPVDEWREGRRAKYLAVLVAMDRQLAVLFDHIRNKPSLRDNTIIIVCSDNGPEPGAGSSGPLRGAKGSLFEGGVRSPLIVWALGLMEKGSIGKTNETAVLAATDLTPSLLSLAGVSAPEGVVFDGGNVAATLLGKSPAPRAAPIYWRRPPDRKSMPAVSKEPMPDLAVRDGEWKLLCDYDGSRPLLYKMPADSGEANNLTAKEPETVARLTKAVRAWHESMPPDRGPQLGMKPESE
ncbi:MAG TPA: sulfatase-like hydrolase/transferase [Verrucomicrobiales bacterium]|nr:sulfatase-like hydrolase/transferase [Verrucomicrobiales bacterium]